MQLWKMEGAWSDWQAVLFDRLIARSVEPVYRRLDEPIAERLGTDGHGLEVGCGSGRLTARLADRLPRARFTGVDLSAPMIRMARERLAGRSGIDLRVADVLRLPFPDGTFDAAWSIASIKHWPDRARGVAEMARVVRPGGSVLLLEVDPACDEGRAGRFVGHWTFVPRPLRPLVVRWFLRIVAAQGVGPDALAALLRRAGLGEVESHSDAEMPAAWAVGRKPTAGPTGAP
jgi:SAM-dependent methyltransferase